MTSHCIFINFLSEKIEQSIGASRFSVTSETELFVTLNKSFKPLTNVRMNSVLDAEKILDPHLSSY